MVTFLLRYWLANSAASFRVRNEFIWLSLGFRNTRFGNIHGENQSSKRHPWGQRRVAQHVFGQLMLGQLEDCPNKLLLSTEAEIFSYFLLRPSPFGRGAGGEGKYRQISASVLIYRIKLSWGYMLHNLGAILSVNKSE